MTAKEQADIFHNMGYNCAQAVACAYCEKAGIDRKTMFRTMEGFGIGMGGMKETCGAVSGAVAIAGALKSSAQTDAPDSKGGTYRFTKEIVEKFIEKNGSAVCGDLKGVETGKVLRPCRGCIQDACSILEEVFPELRE